MMLVSKKDSGDQKLARSFAKQHRTCRAYGFRKDVIEKRQATIQKQMHRTIEALKGYMVKLEENARQWQPSFDPHLLSYAMDECVKKGQKRLRDEFDYKRKMITINMNDHYLIHSFYELQPTKEQVSSKRKRRSAERSFQHIFLFDLDRCNEKDMANDSGCFSNERKRRNSSKTYLSPTITVSYGSI